MQSHVTRSPFKWIFLLCWFFYGLFVFLTGFLLNRMELPHISSRKESPHPRNEYNRLILLLVDGLSYDFIRRETNTYTNNVRNQLKFTADLIEQGQARLFHFIADPPTTTLQRIKGIMTGSMPTFVDAGSNFGSAALIEDSLITQWLSNGKQILFVGDDTWTSLFPGRFHESHPFPSFNVKDLDTVDKAVFDVLESALSNSSAHIKWDVAIGHMLGIDHCGHSFGPAHIEMRRKLHELDSMLRMLVRNMREGDLLVVFGDHGMTNTGDHGGDSHAEVDAALLVYSKSGFHVSPSGNIVSQIDLVPTLALLTAVPIPFSNLGICIESLFGSRDRFDHAVRENFIQMTNYTRHYGNTIGSLPFAEHLPELLSDTQDSSLLALSRRLTTEEMLQHMSRLQSAFRTHWTRFNLSAICCGLCLMFVSVIALLCSSRLTRKQTLILFVLFGMSLLVLRDWLISYATFFSVFLLLVSLLSQLKEFPVRSVFPVFILGLGYFSNSFLIMEIHTTVYLIQTAVILLVYSMLRRNLNNTSLFAKPVSLMVGARFMTFLETCREESPVTSSCRPTLDPWIAKPLSKLTSEEFWETGLFRLCLLIATFVSLWMVYHFRFKRTQALSISAYFLTISGMISVVCWILDVLELTNVAPKQVHYFGTIQNARVGLARLNLFGAFIFFLYLLNPRFFTSPSLRTKGSHDNSFHTLDRFADVSVDWLASMFLILPIALLCVFLNEAHSASLVFVPVAVMLFGFTLANSTNDPASISSWYSASFLCFLDNLSFYTTGHQPTIAAIPWNAAFVAYSGDHDTQLLPALMVSTHLYAGPIVVVCSINLMVFVILHRSAFKQNMPTTKPVVHAIYTSCFSVLCELIGRFLTCKAILTTLCALGTALLRRHLMVWKIFAPRLLFSALSLVVSAFASIVVYVIAMYRFGTMKHHC